VRAVRHVDRRARAAVDPGVDAVQAVVLMKMSIISSWKRRSSERLRRSP